MKKNRIIYFLLIFLIGFFINNISVYAGPCSVHCSKSISNGSELSENCWISIPGYGKIKPIHCTNPSVSLKNPGSQLTANCSFSSLKNLDYNISYEGDDIVNIQFTPTDGITITDFKNSPGVSIIEQGDWFVKLQSNGNCSGFVTAVGTGDVVVSVRTGGSQSLLSSPISGKGTVNDLKTVNFTFAKCGGEEKKCCEPGVDPSVVDTSNVHNCCLEGAHSIIEEYKLDELFCDVTDNEPGDAVAPGKVAHYFEKCRADYYIDQESALAENPWCDLYCTERVEIDAPHAIGENEEDRINAGRYFSLPGGSGSGIGPVMDGVKRCRVRTKYHLWEETYAQAVEKQKEGYNNYQIYESVRIWMQNIQDELDDALKKKASTSNITKEIHKFWVECYDNVSKAPKIINGTTGSKDDPMGQYTTYSWKWTNSNFLKDKDSGKSIQHVLLAKVDRDHDYGSYKHIFVEPFDKVDITGYGPEGTGFVYADDNGEYSKNEGNSKAQCDANAKAETENQLNNASCRCVEDNSPTGTAEAPSKYLGEAKAKRDSGKAEYISGVEASLELEKDMLACNLYFDEKEGPGYSADNYKLDAQYYFIYNQVFLDKDKKLKIERNTVNYDGGCSVEDVNLEADGVNTYGVRYSEKYGEPTEDMWDFESMNLKLNYGDKGIFNSQKHGSALTFSKEFTKDGKYEGHCEWSSVEGDEHHTNAPRGTVDLDLDNNYITHGSGEYPTLIADADGNFLTEHHLTGIGENGKFDKYFLEGEACTKQTGSEIEDGGATLTCVLRIKHSLLTTGMCKNVTGNDAGSSGGSGSGGSANSGSIVTNCTVEDSGDHRLFIFQIVDPENPFPNGLKTTNGEIAKNWSNSAIQKFVNENKNNNAYNPNNLSYSFELTTEIIQSIRNYNAKAENGYDDLDLKCQTCLTNKDATCGECYSDFLTALANGDFGAGAWANDKSSINTVRDTTDWRANK